ncbi:MAG: LTA synthase family protein [Synergistaceae bacterium]|nr:LTA synthase family protein [Synergistaceae bacterium]
MRNKAKNILINFLIILLISLASLAFGVKFAIKQTFNMTSIGEIVSILLLPVNGADTRLVFSVVIKTFLYTLIPFVPLIKHRLVKQRAIVVVSLLLFTICFFPAIKEITRTINNYNHPNELLRKYYVSPQKVSITFPNKKRNLVYILVESLETTIFQKIHGGAMDDDVIPELYRLAHDNICFSIDKDCLGMKPSRDGWTIAATVAQTSGIPFIVPWDGNSSPTGLKLLPGVTSLFDILHNNGYKQAYICGSDAHFSGMDSFLTTHRVDFVYDLNTARQEHFVPKDYHDGWWGLEDKKTLEYAKKKLTEISRSNSPFACVIATIDTHFWGGNFRGDCCRQQFAEDWLNVYACTSRQVNAFVEWLKAQPFYENTTIVIIGDHPTRLYDDTDVVLAPKDYQKHIYNCFINSPLAPLKEKNRDFTLYDMFPTILASLGCKMQGDRLALGTNLFSNKTTLYEDLGEEAFWQKFGTPKPKEVEFWEYFPAAYSHDYDELFLLDGKGQSR